MIYDVVERAAALLAQHFVSDMQWLETNKGQPVGVASSTIERWLDVDQLERKAKKRGDGTWLSVWADVATTNAFRQTEGREAIVALQIGIYTKGGGGAAVLVPRVHLAVEAVMRSMDRMIPDPSPGSAILEVSPERDSTTVTLLREDLDAQCKDMRAVVQVPVRDSDPALPPL